eukprot:SAG25_NODE_80_length_16705_cov_9.579746_1_plen_42_part_10
MAPSKAVDWSARTSIGLLDPLAPGTEGIATSDEGEVRARRSF